MKKCELKVVKFSKGAKVYEEVLGDVMVFEGRISAKVWEKWHKIAYEKIKVGSQEYLGFYISGKKVNTPEPLSDFAYVEK